MKFLARRPVAGIRPIRSGAGKAAAPTRSQDAGATLTLAHATRHNLKDLTVEIPLGRFVCVTGVSGSGKTTLVREVLLPALESRVTFHNPKRQPVKASERIENPASRFRLESGGANGSDPEQDDDKSSDSDRQAILAGHEPLGRVVLVDQSILGKTPRSNPAVYIGAFDDIREFFAQSEPARQRGLNASAFSFNSGQGQCERCRGAGFEKIEMQFLSDVFIRCPDCNGRRYRPHILEVTISSKSNSAVARAGVQSPKAAAHSSRDLSIADMLEATVDEAIDFFGAFPSRLPPSARSKA